MVNILLNILPVFIIIFLGGILKHKIIKADEFWRGLEKLTYYVLFPALLIESLPKAELGSIIIIKLTLVIISSTSLVAAALIIIHQIRGGDDIIFTSVFQGGVRYNNYVFFAISSSFFGEKGVAIAAVISAYMIIYTNLISVAILNSYVDSDNSEKSIYEKFKETIYNICLNPLITSSLLGILLYLFDVKLNFVIDNTLKSLGQSALAPSVLCVGAGLKFRLNSGLIKQVLYSCFVKLAVLPIVTLITLKVFAITDITFKMGMLFSALPTAGSSYVLSKQLGGDPDSMATIITFTTIFSVISMSLFLYIF
jgi:predicted permease